MRGFPVPASLMAGVALCLATGVAAQDTCYLSESRSSHVQMTRDTTFNHISQPVFRCEGGVTIRADSAVAELSDVAGYTRTRFIGNFEYRDSTAFMTADRADHYASADQLIGVGNVHITDGATGAVFEGDSTVLLGSSSRRADGQLTIVGTDGRRAHAIILVSPRPAAPDSTEMPSDSAAMAADADSAAGAANPDSVAIATSLDSAAAATGSDSVAAAAAATDPDSAAVATDPADAAGATPDSAMARVGVPAAAPADSASAETRAGDPGPTDSTRASGESATVVPDPVPARTDARRQNAPPPDSAASASADSAASAAEPPSASGPPPRDTTPVPYDVHADRIQLRGAGHLLATGNAEVRNDEFRALGDSIEYREETGMLHLRGPAPRVFGLGAAYVLSGGEVDLDMDGSQAMARGDAALSGSEIDLTAPEIRVLTEDGALNRIVAMRERPPETDPDSAAMATDRDAAAIGPAAIGPAADAAAPPQDSGAVATPGSGEAADDVAPGSGQTALGDEASGDEATEVDPAPAAGEREAGTVARAAGEGEAGTPEEGAPQPAAGEPGDSVAARRPARPRAVAETFELEGDSIDVNVPNEVLERVVAVGGARGESLARDSLNTESTPDIARSDWVSGDTITAFFQPVPAADSSEPEADSVAGAVGGGYRLDMLVASGRARSLYRMIASGGGGDEDAGTDGAAEEEAETEPPSPREAGDEAPATREPGEAAEAGATEDETGLETPATGEGEAGAAATGQGEREEISGTGEPGQRAAEEEAAGTRASAPENLHAFHYVTGDLITMIMRDGEVPSVVVEGNAKGAQFEPLAPPPPGDTATAQPSTPEMR